KKSLNLDFVSIVSMILKTVVLSSSSNCWINSICSMADLFSMTISLDYQQYSYLYLSPLKMNALNYILQQSHPSSTLNGGQIGDPVQLINVTKTEYMYRYQGQERQD